MRCDKCGNSSPAVVWVQATNEAPEHLECKCPCGYEWQCSTVAQSEAHMAKIYKEALEAERDRLRNPMFTLKIDAPAPPPTFWAKVKGWLKCE